MSVVTNFEYIGIRGIENWQQFIAKMVKELMMIEEATSVLTDNDNKANRIRAF